MDAIYNFETITSQIKKYNRANITLIVVSKNSTSNNIIPILDKGHIHFGENKVQEAKDKWPYLKNSYPNAHLHFIGKLQSNKVRDVVKIFDYVHSLENEKLARLLDDEENKTARKLKYFIQVNLANETMKSGVSTSMLDSLIRYCKNQTSLNVVGLMCLPPLMQDCNFYFKQLKELSIKCNLTELSMGMSNDYDCAINNGSTFIRVGSKIFTKG